MTIMNQVKTDNSSSTLASNSTVLRIVTAGSVDNGKSTLIGRLLYDSKKILQDQLENMHKLIKESLDKNREEDIKYNISR